MTETGPKPTVRPPKHLKAATKKWFVKVIGEWQLEPHHILPLVGGREALDRAEEARLAIELDGAYQKNRFGEVRKHPALGVERDAMTTFSRLLRELDLDIAPPAEAKRPPQLRSIRRGA